MPRITSLNILLESEGKDYLSELYGRVIENVQKTLISSAMKNTELSGDPVSGSVEAKRLANATSKNYGTARAAGKGNAVKASSVTVPTNLLDRLEAIAQRVTFTMPAVAGSVVPYQVSSPDTDRDSKAAETIEASNEELGSVVIQVVSQAAAAIVRAIEENSGNDKPLDRAQLLRAVKEDLSKETKMRGRTLLPV